MPQLTKKEKKKAERAEFLRKSLSEVRKKVRSDLKKGVGSKDFCAALAVALIDETYARIGNQNSEEENGHYGITGWRKKHLTFKGGNAIVKYVGKSGVKHTKTIRNKAVVSALRALADRAEDGESPLLQYDYDDRLSRLTSTDVNSYLKGFDVTAKDIRGFHANAEMKKALKDLRSENGALPDDKEAREKQLTKEFEQALKTVAKCLGHEEKTLRSHYLVHNFEKTFFEEGKPLEKFSSTGQRLLIAHRVALRVYRQRYGTPYDYEL